MKVKVDEYILDWESKRKILEIIPISILRDFCIKRDIFIFSKKKNDIIDRMLNFSLSLVDIKELIEIFQKQKSRASMAYSIYDLDDIISLYTIEMKLRDLKYIYDKNDNSLIFNISQNTPDFYSDEYGLPRVVYKKKDYRVIINSDSREKYLNYLIISSTKNRILSDLVKS